jgi:DNA-binding LytR/AlgR family response regulator
MNLARMQQILSTSLQKSASMFARIGKRYIINLNYVYHIAVLRQNLELSDGENFNYTLSVSKDALKGLREMFVNGLGTSVEDINETE